LREAERAIELLKSVRDPITEMGIVESGILAKVQYDETEGKLVVYLDLARRTPAHPFEMAINWAVHSRIVRDVVKALEDEFPNIEVVDASTLQRYYPIEEW